MTTEKSWLSARKAGEYFDIPRKTLLSLAARGRLPQGSWIRLGRQLRFNIRIIEEAAGKRAR